MSRRRNWLVEVVNACAIVIAAWLSLDSHRPNLAPWLWHTMTRVSRVMAAGWGQLALWCEANYWRTVRA